MLVGKFWILPDDGKVIAVGSNEHADYSKAEMLNLDFYTAAGRRLLGRNVFEPLTEQQVILFHAAGVPKAELDWVTDGKDSRTWAVREWHWIRVAGPAFNVWAFNDETVDQIRGARAYWQAQYALNDYDVLDIDEMSTNETFTVKVKFLRNLGSTAEALRYQATAGVGKWRNPPWETVEEGEYRIQLAPPGMAGAVSRRGMLVDTFVADPRDGVVTFKENALPPWLAVKIANVYFPVEEAR